MKINANRYCYIHPFVWKKIFFISYDLLIRSSFRYIAIKNSAIPPILTKKKYFIWVGNRWKQVKIPFWAVGHKFGEFIRTRKLALYKAKQKRKKLQKKKNKNKNKTTLVKKKKYLFKERTLVKPKFYHIIEKKYFKYGNIKM